MEETKTTTENATPTVAPVTTPAPAGAPARRTFAPRTNNSFGGGQRSFGTGSRGPGGAGGRRGGRDDSRSSEFDQKTLLARRVTRVTSGGRRFSLAVLVALGDKKGRIGLGVGKALDTALAINKATRDAKKNMIKVDLTKGLSIPHDIHAKYSTSKIYLFPNKSKGIVAGSAVREILVLVGAKDVTAKILSGSKNKMNIAKATLKALSVFGHPIVAAKKIRPKADAVEAKENK